MQEKIKAVMYTNEVRVLKVVKLVDGKHAKLSKDLNKCPLLKPDGSSDSWLIKRWVPI